jgi:hypothetical protein
MRSFHTSTSFSLHFISVYATLRRDETPGQGKQKEKRKKKREKGEVSNAESVRAGLKF